MSETLNKIIIFAFAAMIASLSSACSNGKRSDSSGHVKHSIFSSCAEAPQFPDVPETLNDPVERADYLTLHFWDSLDHSAPTIDSAVVEQLMANFLSVLPYASEAGIGKAVAALLDAARESSANGMYGYVMQLAEHYLYEPDSPMFDEQLYAMFLRYQLAAGDNKEDGDWGAAAVARDRLDQITRNTPGQAAPDFTFTQPDGSTATLLREDSRAGILLFFYEPGCDRCHEAARLLSSSATLQRAVADEAVRVVMVYPGDDYAAWAADSAVAAQGWERGIDLSGTIDSEELYVVRATPSFYLISPDGLIILKDARLSEIARALGL